MILCLLFYLFGGKKLKYNFKITIDKNAIINNVNYLQKINKKKLIAVVKGNAYGHGLKQIVSILSEHNHTYFAVARECEALEILSLHLPNTKILLFESLSNFSLLKKYSNLEMVINTIDMLKKAISENINPLQLHIKFDFGFARNGIIESDIHLLETIIKNNNLKFKGAMTHFFDNLFPTVKDIQEKFMKTINFIGREHFDIIHSQNTISSLSQDSIGVCKDSTHIRCGLGILGILENGIFDKNIKRTFKLIGKIEDIKNIENLNFLGYSKIENINLHNSNKFKNIAKIKIGIADGYCSRNKNIPAIINDKEFNIVQISMDTSFILVDDFVRVGDEVELFSDFNKIEKNNDLLPSECITLLNNRLERIIFSENI